MIAVLLGMFLYSGPCELQLSCTNIREAKGKVYVAVFNRSSDFLQYDKMIAQQIIPVSRTGNLDIQISNLPPGEYAVSCFHDVNGNGKLDTNFLGIPIEPYGFSNNARPKFRAPYWSEAVFQLSNSNQWQQITLERW